MVLKEILGVLFLAVLPFVCTFLWQMFVNKENSCASTLETLVLFYIIFGIFGMSCIDSCIG